MKNKLYLVLGILTLCVVSVGSASAFMGLFGKKKDKKLEAQTINEVNEANKKDETLVLLKTDKGAIKVKLFMDEAPVTAGNFKDLVERRFYDGLIFHRLISNFMIQGGCPHGNGTGNFVDPETGKTRHVPFEIPGAELSADAKALLKNKRGRLAMARTQDPNSASSQFFINLVDNAFLDTQPGRPGYAVFGEVVDGMDIVDKIMSENVAPAPGSDGTSNPVHIENATLI